MMHIPLWLVTISHSVSLAALLDARDAGFPVKIETKRELDSRLANVHFSSVIDEQFEVTYGSCVASQKEDAHHYVGVNVAPSKRDLEEREASTRQTRLVWILPEDISSHGCLSAWTENENGDSLLVGRSSPLVIGKKHRHWKRAAGHQTAGIQMDSDNGINAEGTWFDGVTLLKNKEIGTVDARKAKKKKIAIVGAGMSGLMTFLCLNQSGFKNVELIEAGQRLGGRVHTEYLEGGPFDYQYQEMGPMRFPESTVYADTNETVPINDHRIVFQLAATMNIINNCEFVQVILRELLTFAKSDIAELEKDFIPWYQTSPNGLYYFDGIKKANGKTPTLTEAQKNPSLMRQTPDQPELDRATKIISQLTANETLLKAAAKNIYAAHKAFIDSGLDGLGGDNWSEFAYLHNYLNFTLNITDQAGGSGDDFWGSIYDNVYFTATNWKTINGGLNRLPLSFHPLVDPVTTMNRSIERASFSSNTSKVTLSWRDSMTSRTWYNASYDYAMIAVPFSIVRRWRFPNTYFDPTLTSAIANVPYTPSCKVALQFATRFWEHYEKPIIGSCSTTTDIPGIGSICYPSYNVNASGPGVMLSSYSSGDWGARLVSLTEEQHVAYVLDAMVEIHGEIARKQYTGKYNRRCWLEDPLETAAWASPSVGQHQLYIPAYFRTENHMIFVGEHTSYTHAWIASALESGVRGAVQLMLELGLVDEAKEITKNWMGRWISI